MNSNLVTTYVPETFSLDSKNILLGKWCNPYNANPKLFANTKYIKYHWDDFTKMDKDYDYLYEIYHQSIDLISKELNEFHKLDKPTKFWEIIIGPWLANQLTILWDRWENIRVAFENENVNFTKCLKYSDADLVPCDYIDMISLMNTHKWNHLIYSEIINFGFKEKLEIKKIEDQTYKKEKFYKTNIHISKINPIKLFMDKIFSKLETKRKVMMYRSYFGFYPTLLLSLKLGDYPRGFFEFDKKINLPNPINRNHLEIDMTEKNNFEYFYKKNIFKYMPIAYLEGFKLLEEKTKMIKSKQKIIFTANGHVANDFFKIWTANEVIKGKKYIISDHGGYWQKAVFFDSWRKTCDYFLTWNLTKEENCLQVPINITFKKRKLLNKNNGKYILFLTNNSTIYTCRIGTPPQGGQMLNDYETWKVFFNKLENNIKDNLILRTHPSDHNKIKLRFLDDFGARGISKKKSLKKDILRSKIIVNTTAQTALYESMKSGVPTLLLFDRNILKINPSIQELLYELKENNIMFSDPAKAAQHVKNIWLEPLEWWNSTKIIKLREKFSLSCSKEVKSDLLFWKNFFNSALIDNEKNFKRKNDYQIRQ